MIHLPRSQYPANALKFQASQALPKESLRPSPQRIIVYACVRSFRPSVRPVRAAPPNPNPKARTAPKEGLMIIGILTPITRGPRPPLIGKRRKDVGDDHHRNIMNGISLTCLMLICKLHPPQYNKPHAPSPVAQASTTSPPTHLQARLPPTRPPPTPLAPVLRAAQLAAGPPANH
ncbi:hypothetical protein Dda_7089 [Drechslerella dactyloides]|uniref:Uncharacterized protein n=1 Tax=Drechslerella dactyloides TaxID=74499 RepID=A0AAD6ITM6_DREDA|nr:hypothetical protein Dda_7089 [Drechslerella dactyloides]